MPSTWRLTLPPSATTRRGSRIRSAPSNPMDTRRLPRVTAWRCSAVPESRRPRRATISLPLGATLSLPLWGRVGWGFCSKLSTINVFAYQHGIYPRSEKVVASTRGLDRGRVDADAVVAAFAEELAAFVRLQQKSGFDEITDGLLRWQDIFRPLVGALGAAKPESLVRWFDTNTFFREPELSGALAGVNHAVGLMPDASVPRPRVATLPSPFMFSRAARTDRDRNQLMVDLAGTVLRPVVDAAGGPRWPLLPPQEALVGYFWIQAQNQGPVGGDPRVRPP